MTPNHRPLCLLATLFAARVGPCHSPARRSEIRPGWPLAPLRLPVLNPCLAREWAGPARLNGRRDEAS